VTDDAPTPAQGTPPRLSIVSTRRTLWTAAIAGVIVLVIGVWLVVTRLPHFLNESATPAGSPAPASTAEARKIQAALFYVSDDGSALVSRTREVLYGATTAEQIRRIVEAQVQVPLDGTATAIPPGTTVRGVFIGAHNEAFVDLAGAIRSGHSGGSLNEALAVYAIINAVTVNIPDVAAVQILIDGRQVDTLAGHIDLRYPLGKALDWVQKGQ
jgi:hypothetical protein